MKRILSLIEVIMLLFFVRTAFSEEIDLTQLSDSELLILDTRLEEEIYSRQGYTPNVLYPGHYTVGKEVEPGEYIFVAVEKVSSSSSKGIIELYDNDSSDRECIDSSYFVSSTDKFHMTFSEGNYIYVYGYVFVYTKVK